MSELEAGRIKNGKNGTEVGNGFLEVRVGLGLQPTGKMAVGNMDKIYRQQQPSELV